MNTLPIPETTDVRDFAVLDFNDENVSFIEAITFPGFNDGLLGIASVWTVDGAKAPQLFLTEGESLPPNYTDSIDWSVSRPTEGYYRALAAGEAGQAVVLIDRQPLGPTA